MTAFDTCSVEVGGIDIAYRFDGPDEGEVVVLVTGFGDQLIDWPNSLVEGLTGARYRVLRFDPRDSGLSGALKAWQIHDTASLLAAAFGAGPRPGYTLDDLADELLGLIDALGVERVHVIGYSMGGMIAQRAAAKRSFASLTLLFTSSQAPGLSAGSQDASLASLALTQRIDDDADARLAAGLRLVEITNGPVHLKSAEQARIDVGAQNTRAYRPEGVGRMMLALLKSPPASDRLHDIDCPCLVLAAETDCFFASDHGADLVRRIRGASLETIPGSGHNLPESLGREIAARWLAHFGGQG